MQALRALQGYRQGFELRALAASSPEKAAAAAQAYDVPLAFGTPGELAACDEVDLVVVSVRLPRPRRAGACRPRCGQGGAVRVAAGPGPRRGTRPGGRRPRPGAAHRGRTAGALRAAVRYVADLIAQGYAGEVLSATLVGSGGSWGATIPAAGARYLADPAAGATMLTIPFGHTVDGLALALGEPAVQHATLATRRPLVLDADSGDMVPMTAADQIAVTAACPAARCCRPTTAAGSAAAPTCAGRSTARRVTSSSRLPGATCRWHCPPCSADTARTGSFPRSRRGLLSSRARPRR